MGQMRSGSKVVQKVVLNQLLTTGSKVVQKVFFVSFEPPQNNWFKRLVQNPLSLREREGVVLNHFLMNRWLCSLFVSESNDF